MFRKDGHKRMRQKEAPLNGDPVPCDQGTRVYQSKRGVGSVMNCGERSFPEGLRGMPQFLMRGRKFLLLAAGGHSVGSFPTTVLDL